MVSQSVNTQEFTNRQFKIKEIPVLSLRVEDFLIWVSSKLVLKLSGTMSAIQFLLTCMNMA